MNQQLKIRLVGAVVLVSLAVIIIPMVLDGSDREASPLSGQFIPERSGLRVEPLEIPLQPVPPVAPQQPRLVDPSPNGERTPERAPPKVDEAAPPPPVVKPPAPPVETPAVTDTVGWVVQVGSFSRQENALALRERLRGQGYAAFVDRATTANGATWRVRVGPELKRENAEKHRQRLQQELQMEGIVLSASS